MVAETGWSPHRLTGVADDHIQPVQFSKEMIAKELDARRVAQVQSKDLQPVLPVGEVFFSGVSRGGISREAGGYDDLCACSEQENGSLVTDLDPGTRDECRASPEVGALRPLFVVQISTGCAHLIIEMMQPSIAGLTDVAMALFHDLLRIRRAGQRPAFGGQHLTGGG